jgi:hypothetical protein
MPPTIIPAIDFVRLDFPFTGESGSGGGGGGVAIACDRTDSEAGAQAWKWALERLNWSRNGDSGRAKRFEGMAPSPFQWRQPALNYLFSAC